MVSGDGEYVRHAITNEEGFQLARVWMEDSSSMGHWVPGCVNAGGSLQPGMLAAGSRHLDYQVLTASQLHSQLLHDISKRFFKWLRMENAIEEKDIKPRLQAAFCYQKARDCSRMGEMWLVFRVRCLVLFAGPVPQSLREGSAEVSRLLSLSISLDTLDGMLENDLTPPEVPTFLLLNRPILASQCHC